MDRRRAGRDILGVFFVCVHPTITIREHLLDRFTEVRKTFQGKTIISIGCLHSFQELLYIVLTLEGYFLSSREQPETCVGTFARNATSCFFTRS